VKRVYTKNAIHVVGYLGRLWSEPEAACEIHINR
jgi:hypothetical protein